MTRVPCCISMVWTTRFAFDPIGRQTKATRQELGIWAEAQVDIAKQYGELVISIW